MNSFYPRKFQDWGSKVCQFVSVWEGGIFHNLIDETEIRLVAGKVRPYLGLGQRVVESFWYPEIAQRDRFRAFFAT